MVGYKSPSRRRAAGACATRPYVAVARPTADANIRLFDGVCGRLVGDGKIQSRVLKLFIFPSARHRSAHLPPAFGDLDSPKREDPKRVPEARLPPRYALFLNTHALRASC